MLCVGPKSCRRNPWLPRPWDCNPLTEESAGIDAFDTSGRNYPMGGVYNPCRSHPAAAEKSPALASWAFAEAWQIVSCQLPCMGEKRIAAPAATVSTFLCSCPCFWTLVPINQPVKLCGVRKQSHGRRPRIFKNELTASSASDCTVSPEWPPALVPSHDELHQIRGVLSGRHCRI